PAVAAICYLISQLPVTPFGPPRKDVRLRWQRHPFVFRAFKLAVAELLDALEPKGEIESRSLGIHQMAASRIEATRGTPFQKTEMHSASEFVETWKSPQSVAHRAAMRVLHDLYGGLASPDSMMASWDEQKKSVRDHIAVLLGEENIESFVAETLGGREDQ